VRVKQRVPVLIVLVLVVLTLAVFLQVRDHDFVNIDDYAYVTRNPSFEGGPTMENAAKAFEPYAAYWIPLTWLSLLLDFEFYGQDATGFLLTNLALHIANVLLLFWLFVRLTRATWPAAFVAAAFAIHPLHVESAPTPG
jgi:hypothetical protein